MARSQSNLPHRFPRIAAGLLLLSLMFAASTSAQFIGNFPAGVEVDAEGVLRMKQVRDGSGRLTKQRLSEMKAALDPDLAQPSDLRKVSLTRLEAAITHALQTGSGLSDEMKFLAGMTRLQYVFLYTESNDIVIAGPAEGYGIDAFGRPIGLQTGQSILELQDLIVALRSFAPNAQATPVIGCSIDPTPEGLQRMQQFLVNISGRIQPSDAEQVAIGLRENLGNQLVTIEGVPANTHFARVLAEADYRMKLIGIGLEKPPVNIASYVSKANPNSVARNAMQRWYFVPNYEAIRVSQDGMAVAIEGDGVKLIGQTEMVNRAGGRQQSGSVDRASLAFANSFTKSYNRLAERVPVYGQLRNLIDMAVAAAIIQKNDFYAQANWDLGVLGDENLVPVETYEAPKRVGSAVNVVWKGNRLMTPIGGGVNIQPNLALRSDAFGVEEENEVSNVKSGLNLDDLPAGQWWWD